MTAFCIFSNIQRCLHVYSVWTIYGSFIQFDNSIFNQSIRIWYSIQIQVQSPKYIVKLWEQFQKNKRKQEIKLSFNITKCIITYPDIDTILDTIIFIVTGQKQALIFRYRCYGWNIPQHIQFNPVWKANILRITQRAEDTKENQSNNGRTEQNQSKHSVVRGNHD